MKGARVKALSTAAVLTLGVLSAPSMAAVDMFLKIGDIEGESQDSTHKGEIDVLAWSWGLSQSGTRGRANGACIQDLGVTKWIDKASVDLIMGATIGETYEEATLVVRKAGKIPLEYLKVKMRDVQISSVSTGGSGGEDRLTENVTLNFSEANWEYTEQTPDGSPGGTTSTVVKGSAGGCR